MLYETDKDVAKETIVAAIIAASMGCKSRKIKGLKPLDRWLYDNGGIFAGLEIKCRSGVCRYPTLMLSKHKADGGAAMCRHVGCRVAHLIAFAFDDAIYVVTLNDQTKYTIVENGGRTKQTRRPEDIETVLHFPVTEAKIVNWWE